MKEETFDAAAENLQKEDRPKVSLFAVVKETLRHWPWILLSVVVCMGLGTLHYLHSIPQYARKASVVIKDAKNNAGYGGMLGEISDMGFGKKGSNIHDEIGKFKSPDLMDVVVRKLGLDMNYESVGLFHDTVKYGEDIPIQVTFLSLGDADGASMRVKIDKKEKIKISKLAYLKEENIPVKGEFDFNKPIPTPIGKILISKGPGFVPGRNYEINVSKSSIQDASSATLAKVIIDLSIKEGTTLNLTAVDPSPQRASDILMSMIDTYNERWVESRNEVAEKTGEFINQRLVTLQSELGDINRNISDYRSENLLADMTTTAQMYANQTQDANKQIQATLTQLKLAENTRAIILENTAAGKSLPINMGIVSQIMDQQVVTYNDYVAEKQRYADISKDHPKIAEIDRELTQIRNSILHSVDNQIAMLRKEVNLASSATGEAKTVMSKMPKQQEYLAAVGRDKGVKESLYAYLLRRGEENEMSKTYNTTNTDIVMMPRGDYLPVSPRRKLIFAGSFMIGLIIPFAYFYFFAMFNTKVRTKKDLESLKVPMIAEIPEYKAMHKENRPKKGVPLVVVKSGKRNVINESFRVLRTNLEFMGSREGHGNVIMLTSFDPGSGKTFIAVNTGIALAIKGKRVVVVDCDMRRAATSEYVGTPDKGLSNYLVGSEENIYNVMVCNTIVNDLCVIPVGTLPPNPSELLESPRFPELIEQLRSEFDYVIVDCPPAEMMADAKIINEVSDRTIFVVRAGVMPLNMIPELNELYKENKFKNLSYIFNGVKMQNSTYSKGYANSYGLNED